MAKENVITITLADGTQLSGLEMNGNNFISPVEVTEETFRGKLGKVVISGNAETDEAGLIGEHEHMELVQIAHYTQATHGMPDGWYFILREIPAEEREKRQLRADVDFAIMLGGASF